jgi:hypothetical protein
MARTKKPTPTAADAPAQAAGEPQVIPTVRQICEKGLLAGHKAAQIIEDVKAVYPSAKTSPGCVSWYRSKMAKRGLVPTGAQMAEARRAAADHGGER